MRKSLQKKKKRVAGLGEGSEEEWKRSRKVGLKRMGVAFDQGQAECV